MICKESLCENVVTGSQLDRIGSANNVHWVIDGATTPQSNHLNFDVSTWLVDKFSEQLHNNSLINGLDKLLKQTSQSLANKYSQTKLIGELASAQQPCFTLALAQQIENIVELAVIADAHIAILTTDNKVHLLTDNRIDQFSAKTKLQPSAEAKKEQLIVNRESMNKAGGYWAATVGDKWLAEVKTLRLPKEKVNSILLCSDGFARVVQFGLLSWQEVLSEKTSLNAAYTLLREYEVSAGAKNNEVKLHDDVSALLLSVNP